MIAWFTEGGSDPIDVTVIVLTCDRDRHVSQTLASLRAQTWKGWELLLSDTSAQPQQRMNVEAAFQAHARSLPHHGARLLRPGAGLRPAENLAAAWDAVRTPYVALLGEDDLWMPEHLARARAWLGADARRGLALSNSVLNDDDGHSKGYGHPLDRAVRPEHDVGGTLDYLLRAPFSSASGIVLRKSALRRHRFHVTPCLDLHLCVSALLVDSRVGLFLSPTFYCRKQRSPTAATAWRDRHRLRLHLARRHVLALTRRVPSFPLLVVESASYLALASLRRLLARRMPPPPAAHVAPRPQPSLHLR